MTKCSRGSRESSDSEGRDIQVVTDIHVHVEGGEEQTAKLKTPQLDVSETVGRDRSFDGKVKDARDMV
jgi:hypothetical protein